MIVTFNINEKEARDIIAQWFANKHYMDADTINVVIGVHSNCITDLETSYKNVRQATIKKITELLPKSKIEAIQVFRLDTGASLKDAKFFVESVQYWNAYIERGHFPTSI